MYYAFVSDTKSPQYHLEWKKESKRIINQGLIQKVMCFTDFFQSKSSLEIEHGAIKTKVVI